MSNTDPNAAKLAKRQEILDELWALVGTNEHPGSVSVAALDRIARIEDAYSPVKIEPVKKYRNLADFYAGVGVGTDITAGVESVAQAGEIMPTGMPPSAVAEDEIDSEEEDGFL